MLCLDRHGTDVFAEGRFVPSSYRQGRQGILPGSPNAVQPEVDAHLLGGGAIYTITPYVYVPEEWEKKGLGPTRSTGTYLQVYASPEEGDSDVAIVGDIYKGPNYEMAAQAVVFPEGHQAVADRVAKTLALIDSDCASISSPYSESVWVDVLHRELDSNHFAELLMLDPENPGDWPSFIGEPWKNSWPAARSADAKRFSENDSLTPTPPREMAAPNMNINEIKVGDGATYTPIGFEPAVAPSGPRPGATVKSPGSLAGSRAPAFGTPGRPVCCANSSRLPKP